VGWSGVSVGEAAGGKNRVRSTAGSKTMARAANAGSANRPTLLEARNSAKNEVLTTGT
jgi:hypothetical protein